MIIKEISLENFRSYYGKHTIKFNDGLMLFIGDNGDGKTTFFEALEWLFDTSKQNIDKNLISRKEIANLPEFGESNLSVSMTFEHDGEKIIEKSFSFTKQENKIDTGNFQFKGWEVKVNERIPVQGSELLDRCFETAIRKYCLLKGENNLNVFNNPDALKYLIDTFSNIRQFTPYFNGNEYEKNIGFTEFSEKEAGKVFRRAMKSDKKNAHQESELSKKLDELEKNLGNIQQRLSTYKRNASNYSSKLNEIESSKEASEQLKQINERLKSLENKKTKAENLIEEDYSIKLLDELWILCGFPSILKEYQKKVDVFCREKRRLEDEDKERKAKNEAYKEIGTTIKEKNFIPLSIYIPDENTMKNLIDEELCKVCGREAKKGTDAYNFMVAKLNELIESNLPKKQTKEKLLFLNNFAKELEQKSINLGYNQEDYNNLISIIKEDIEFNNERHKEVNRIQNSIDSEEENKRKLLAQNDNFSEEELKNNYENISNWFNSKNDADKQITILEIDEKEVKQELKEVKERYNELGKTSTANTYRKIHEAFEKIKNAFKYAKEQNTKDFLNLLEQKANEYHNKLNIDDFTGIIRIYEDTEKKLKIQLEDKSDSFVSNPNQALETTMYMSVLFAVSELTTIKRENDYPLIFDAPTSSFALQKESEFFDVISAIKKQCIIFTKSFLSDESKLLEDKIDKLSCTIYRIEKQRPFDKDDLSTIQTKITLIK